MKMRFAQRLRFAGMFGLVIWGAALGASAQSAAGLSIQTYAGLAITGSVGTVYAIEYITDLARTNDPSAWRCLEYFQLPASPYLWIDRSAPATGRRFYRARAFAAPRSMVFIPPGSFRMGSPTNEVPQPTIEGPQTMVMISRGFWMGKYEVTQGEYLIVMGSNPSYFIDLNRPVETVSWEDATNYCAKLTELDRSAGRIAPNSVYRLPTEAEWEYACRAWTSDRRFSYGDDPGYTNLTHYAWYDKNSGDMTHKVGQKLPNPWGLYDMHGNVWEWCQDSRSESLPGGIVVDPQWSNTDFSPRALRGGSVWHSGHFCRSACRLFWPSSRGTVYGFRVVLAPSR